MLDTLTDQQIYDLIRDHWREIKGLAKEIERRKQKMNVGGIEDCI